MKSLSSRWPRLALSAALLVCLAAEGGCEASENNDSTSKVNGSVHVAAGKAAAPASTVNGSIEIATDAVVTTAKTVNGGIHLGPHAEANALSTVNGDIKLDAGAKCAGTAETVNGAISLEQGADIGGAATNVNDKIELHAAHVGGGINTVDGDIIVGANSHVQGGIHVQKPSDVWFHFGSDVPRIVIGPGASVEGNLRFEREVKLYVSDRASIGTVSGATAISFSGDAPPR
jgi:cytoskeletal protein CcmA (bactofilin family)